MTSPEDPRRHPARTAALTGLIGEARAGGRSFVDATGAAIALPTAVERLVATDAEVGAVLLDLGAPLVGCAGTLDGIAPVGAPGRPDPDAVAALRPHLIVTGVVDRAHAVEDAGTVDALRRIAPVVAVDAARPAAARADLRALFGPVASGPPAPLPPSRPIPPPTWRPADQHGSSTR